MTVYDTIYEKAKCYLDTRQNEVHVALSYAFAQRLLDHYPDARGDIVLPAILLHDVGWKMVPEGEQIDAFGPKASNNGTRRLHEVEGARIAADILDSIDYEPDKIREICSIIDGHDSRPEALSLNDALVKDSDKLWRFTPTGVRIDHARFHIDREIYLDYLASVIDAWLLMPKAREIALEALSEAKGTSGKSAG